MPRKRKRNKKGRKDSPKQQARIKERDKVIAKFWTAAIRSAIKRKDRYVAAAREVSAFMKNEHDALFGSEDTQKYFMDFRGAAAVSVPKVAQMRNSLGPRLYFADLVRTVSPNTDDMVSAGLAKVLEGYLNYTVKESKFPKQFRKTIDDGLTRGRCVLSQIYDPVRGIVTSKYLSSLDFVFDPDYFDPDEAKWVAFRVREPLWQTKRRVKEKWRIKDLEPRKASLSLPKGSESGDDDDESDDRRDKGETCPVSADQVSYWVVLSKMGLGFRGAEQDSSSRFNDSEDFVRLEIVLDHGAPLAEGPWDVPLYMDEDWPLSYKDLIEPIDEHWPDSPSGQVLPLQKAVDLLTSLRLTSAKNRDRLVVFSRSDIAAQAQNILRHGSSADFISLDLPQGVTLQDVIQIADFGQGSPESQHERAFLINEIETTTGVTETLHGGGGPGAVERSAAASSIKAGAADTRVGDLRARAEELATDAARKEAIIARLTLDEDQITPYVQASQIGMYYPRLEVPGAGVVPVRDIRDPKEKREDPEGGPITLEQIHPKFSTYYADPTEALMAAEEMWGLMQQATDPRVIELRDIVAREGVAQEDGLPIGLYVDVVTPARVWEDTSGMAAEEVMREVSISIASGSGIKFDKQAEQANADTMVQQTMPTALSMGDVETANKILEIRDEAYEVPADKRVTFSPPPPPTEEEPAQ